MKVTVLERLMLCLGTTADDTLISPFTLPTAQTFMLKTVTN